MNSFSSRQLNIKTKTWSRDSYGLYDYETTNLNVQNLTIAEPCNLARVENQITNAPKPKRGALETSTDSPLPLAYVQDNAEGVKITANRKEGEANEDDFWYIIERGENAKGYMLKSNDVIKLGRVMFKVNQIKVMQDHDEPHDPSQKTILDSIKEHMQKTGTVKNSDQNNGRRNSIGEATCKVCLADKEEDDDPLISPCNCIGSVKYVHLKCIQNWIKSKLNMQQNKNIITIFWKSLYCELCKQKLPLNVMHNGEELSLLPIANKITGSYVVLESFSKAKDSTGIHIIDLSSNQNFKMGRGHECDLKIADISVSRVHALLVVSKGKLYLKDNLSKFGTLVLQKDPIMVTDENPETPWIQCGRTIFKFVLKKSWTAFIPFVGTWFNKIPKISKLFGEAENNQDEGGNLVNNGEDGKRSPNTDI